MTTFNSPGLLWISSVVEAYRLDRYDNLYMGTMSKAKSVVEAYRLDRYDNFARRTTPVFFSGCRSLSFG